MDVRYERRFERDLNRTRNNPALRRRVEAVITELEAAPAITSVRGADRLQGSTAHYRIRIGNYRLGIEVEGTTAILVRLRHRRDFYRGFP